jgi:hypothetical protein
VLTVGQASSKSLTPIGFAPNKVFKTIVESFLHTTDGEAKHPGFASQVQSYYSTVVNRYLRGESMLDQHIELLGTHKIALPGCNCCMLRAPMHRLTCQHRFCHYCLVTTAHKAITACPLCGGSNEEDVLIVPPTAGIRALVLSDPSPARTVEFLAALRRKLNGHLEDYFDMIVASKNGMITLIYSS